MGQAIDAVRSYIRNHDLKVGDTLPGEAHFAELVGVSRAVIREAFGALGALRLIDIGNGRRAKVGALDGSVMALSLEHAISTAQITVGDIWDVRRTLECRTVALAAKNRTEAEAEQILKLAEALVAAKDDLAQITQLDIAFHEAIARASHNPLFVQIVTSFAPLMAEAVPRAWGTRSSDAERDRVFDNHLAVADAIADGDPKQALLAMDAHFDATIGLHLER